jgi:hypothetical protein
MNNEPEFPIIMTSDSDMTLAIPFLALIFLQGDNPPIVIEKNVARWVKTIFNSFGLIEGIKLLRALRTDIDLRTAKAIVERLAKE